MERQLKIFKDEVIPISLKEIYSYSFDDFKSKGYLLNSDYEDIILKYYEKVYKNEYIIPFYHCLPTFNSLTKDKKFKFIIVKRGDDTILLVYKVIQILKTRQIRFFDIPISLNGIEENQYELIFELSKKDFIRFCYSFPFTDWFNTAYCNRYPEYDNYYKSRIWFEKTCNISWQKKKGIYEILNNIDFKVIVSDIINENDSKKIRNSFNDYIKKRGGLVSKNDDREFYNIVKCKKHKNIKFISIYYKNEIVALRVVFLLTNINVAYSIYNIHIRSGFIDSVLEKTIKHNFDEKMSFFVFNYFKQIKRLYVLGYMPSEKRLAKHKANIYKDCIKYYIE